MGLVSGGIVRCLRAIPIVVLRSSFSCFVDGLLLLLLSPPPRPRPPPSSSSSSSFTSSSSSSFFFFFRPDITVLIVCEQKRATHLIVRLFAFCSVV